MCQEVHAAGAIDYFGRGFDTRISLAQGPTRRESTCTECGNCIDLCPTGAMYGAPSEGVGRTWDMRQVPTTCPYCGCGCTLILNVRDNRVVRVTSVPGVGINEGLLCVKGRFGVDFIGHEERLTQPLVRRNGELEPATWDEALEVVTKRLGQIKQKFGPDAIREAADCGVEVFGENRVQEAAAKIPDCPGHLTWHLVGHLQRNKVRAAVEWFHLVHAVDSLRLLEAVDRAGEEAGREVPVLLQVNVSGEASKFGLSPDAVPDVLDRASGLMHVTLEGLMTMPPFTEDPEGARPHFQHLRRLRDQWAAATGFPLAQLSMGMSHDFEVAVEEGATLVRIGTGIFGDRPKE
jgi:hypothetical protein